MTTRYANNEALAQSLGLQPGEAYEQAEECHTCISHYKHNGRAFEVYFDEMAGPLSQWKAFCMGIGTRSGLEREEVIKAMRAAIENKFGLSLHETVNAVMKSNRWEYSFALGYVHGKADSEAGRKMDIAGTETDDFSKGYLKGFRHTQNL